MCEIQLPNFVRGQFVVLSKEELFAKTMMYANHVLLTAAGNTDISKNQLNDEGIALSIQMEYRDCVNDALREIGELLDKVRLKLRTVDGARKKLGIQTIVDAMFAVNNAVGVPFNNKLLMCNNAIEEMNIFLKSF